MLELSGVYPVQLPGTGADQVLKHRKGRQQPFPAAGPEDDTVFAIAEGI